MVQVPLCNLKSYTSVILLYGDPRTFAISTKYRHSFLSLRKMVIKLYQIKNNVDNTVIILRYVQAVLLLI